MHIILLLDKEILTRTTYKREKCSYIEVYKCLIHILYRYLNLVFGRLSPLGGCSLFHLFIELDWSSFYMFVVQ